MKRKSVILAILLFWTTVNGVNVFADELEVLRPHKHVLVLLGGAWYETMTVLDAGNSLVVIDTYASYKLAEKAAMHIKKIFDKPVSHVINTHYHWDHTFGNQVFAKAVIIGHRFCAQDMKAEYSDKATRLTAIKKVIHSLKPDHRAIGFLNQVYEEQKSGFRLTLPSLLVDDEHTLRVGNLTVKCYHVPGLHTRSNLTIYVPGLGLVFTRRDFHHDSLPQLEEGVDMPKLLHSLEDILAAKKPVKFIMPGHGKPLADPDLTVSLAYLKRLWNTVNAAKKNGMTLAETEKLFARDTKWAEPVAKFQDRHQSNLKILFEQTPPDGRP